MNFSVQNIVLDYHPFGSTMPGNTYVPSEKYRFGFNGKENDTEWGGGGLTQDYGFRLYNPSLGKFLSIDPLSIIYPELTPYQFANNRPIKAIDFDGLEAWDGPNDAKMVFSLNSYREFSETLIQKITSGEIKADFDCADLALYIWAKYHQEMGVELVYTVPGTSIDITSNDMRFKKFDDFFKGINVDNVYQYGFRGIFGAMHLYDTEYGMTIAVSDIDMGTGDLYMSSGHTIINYTPAVTSNYKIGTVQAQPVNNGTDYFGSQPYIDTYLNRSSIKSFKNRRFKKFHDAEKTNFLDSEIQRGGVPETTADIETNTA